MMLTLSLDSFTDEIIVVSPTGLLVLSGQCAKPKKSACSFHAGSNNTEMDIGNVDEKLGQMIGLSDLDCPNQHLDSYESSNDTHFLAN